MGFINITLIDVIDILVVAMIMFQIYRLTRGTNALRIVIGILIVYLLWIVVRLLKMELLSMILGQIIGVGVIALIVVFQQEIRRFLVLLGTQYSHRKNTLLGRLLKSRKAKDRSLEWIEPLVSACADMAATKTGSLNCDWKKHQLGTHYSSGGSGGRFDLFCIDQNNFFLNSPLHDGAIVIADGRIAAARCVLPSTERGGTCRIRYASSCSARSLGSDRCIGDCGLRGARHDLGGS